MKQYLITNVAAWNEKIGTMAELTVEFPSEGSGTLFVGCVDAGMDDGLAWWVARESARETTATRRPELIENPETNDEAEASPYRELYHLAEDALNLLRRGEIDV